MGFRALLILIPVGYLVLASIRNPHIGLLGFSIMTFIRPERLSYGQLAPFRLFLVLSLAVLVGYLFNQNNLVKLKNYSNVLPCLIIIAICQLIFTPFAVYSVDISWRYATDFAKLVLFCFLMTRLLTDEKKVRAFLMVTTLGVAFVALWGFQQHFLGNPRLEEVAGGNYNESNAVGVLFAQFAPMALSFVFVVTKKWQKWGLFIFFLILCGDIIFTQSRAALLGVLVGSSIFFLYVPMRTRIAILFFGLLLSPLVMSAVNSTEGYSERLAQTEAGEDRGADRLVIWQAGIEIFKDHPWTGVGQQNFKYLAKGYVERMGLPHGFHRLADAHNTLLLEAAETGIVGILALLAAIYFYFLDIRKLKKYWKVDTAYSQYFILLIGLQAGMVSFLIGAMFHSYPVHEHFYWYLIVPGLLLNIYMHQNRSKENGV